MGTSSDTANGQSIGEPAGGAGQSEGQFAWGWTADSVALEGVAAAADWSMWERDGRAPRSGEGCGFGIDFRADLQMLADWGFTHCRLPVEWARVEPEPGKLDHDAIDRYLDMLAAARDAGLQTWLVLQNTTLPGWFTDDEGGWGSRQGRTLWWARWVDRCGEWFSDRVSGWVPVEDPVGWAVRSRILGQSPPGRRRGADGVEAAQHSLEAMFEACRLLRSGRLPIMGVFGLHTVFAADQRSDTLAWQGWWDRLLWQSWISALTDGEITVPDRPIVGREQFREAFDVVGVNFDAPVCVDRHGQLGPYPLSARCDDSGLAPEPEELGRALARLADMLGDHPLAVAGTGVSTADEAWRDQLLGQSLDQVEAARSDSINVVGFFADTAVDGYHWLLGNSTARGLFDRDRNPKDAAFTLRSRIRGIEANQVLPR